MEILADFILSDQFWKNLALAAVFGVIASVIGFGIGTALSKLFNVKNIVQWTVLICVVASVKMPNVIKPYFETRFGAKIEENRIKTVMQDIEKLEFFSVIFEHHPEAKDQFTSAVRGIIFDDDIDQNEKRRLVQQTSAKITNGYYNQYLPLASDALLNRQIDRNLEVLLQFQDRPELCVGYYLGLPIFTASDFPTGFVETESDFKADVILAAINTPYVPSQAPSIDDLINIVIEAYQAKEADLGNLSKLNILLDLDAREACDIAIEFSDVLASLDDETSALVLRGLLLAGNED